MEDSDNLRKFLRMDTHEDKCGFSESSQTCLFFLSGNVWFMLGICRCFEYCQLCPDKPQGTTRSQIWKLPSECLSQCDVTAHQHISDPRSRLIDTSKNSECLSQCNVTAHQHGQTLKELSPQHLVRCVTPRSQSSYALAR